LEIAPDDVELHNALGWTLFQAGQPADAIVEYEKALAADRGHAKAHNNLALALVELGRLEDAAGHFKASHAVEPRAEIYSDFGFALARLGRPDEAQASYRKALELDPRSPSAHANLAVSLAQSGDFTQAEAHYRIAVREKPTADAYNGLGYVLARQGRGDEAIVELRKAIDVDPKFIPAYNNLADALETQGKLEEAAQVYRQSLAEKPSAGTHNALGMLLRRMGQADAAAEQFAKAKALSPGR
jgi:Flp pilus assembly protein TadD